MIVYSSTRRGFGHDVLSNNIEQQILDQFSAKIGQRPSKAEVQSWKNSLQYMNNALTYGDVPEDAGVAIEYRVPLTSKRVDFILSGTNQHDQDTLIIVELKQWSNIEKTQKDAIVRTFVGGARREVTHPSYQAWTYAALIRDFNVEVQRGTISLHPCAYLHNCLDSNPIKDPFYEEHTLRAPVFIRRDVRQLADFIRRFVTHGDRNEVLYRVERSRLKPSKGLADHLVSLLSGNREFEMIDDQKVVYETALALSKRKGTKKQVLLVEGGPGTGKSVVAVNLLVELTRKRLLAHYVSRNAAPRTVYESKLSGKFAKTHITNLFKGSGAYVDCEESKFDCLIVDEAHRLNEKSGFYQNQGDNQIKEIIRSSKLSIFFLDQRVTLKDVGERNEIRRLAKQAGARLTECKLKSQFRCNGSDGFISWVDSALQIVETANPSLEGIDYDFRVFGFPNELREEIFKRNGSNKARMVAGYCWDWVSKKYPQANDVVIPEYDFEMRWNLDKDGPLWIVAPDSISEIGCIHTCQGLELDYIGVIVGEDLVVRNGMVVTDALKRSKNDRSIRGYKSMLRKRPRDAKILADRVVKNTYRTLMTRGQKGCFLFSVDAETNEYFMSFGRDQAPPVKQVWPEAAEPDQPPYDRRPGW